MDFNELKKLVKKIGGVLVMDGEQPSFVMLSYDNYKQLAGESVGDEVLVRSGLPKRSEEFGFGLHSGLASHGSAEEGESLLLNALQDVVDESDEDKINRLNEEIALLKNEIKQRELEVFAPDSD